MLIIITYIILWLSGAHFIKGKVMELINKVQSDNIKLTYKNASIARFPFNWSRKLNYLQLTSITQLGIKEITSDAAKFIT